MQKASRPCRSEGRKSSALSSCTKLQANAKELTSKPSCSQDRREGFHDFMGAKAGQTAESRLQTL